MQAVTDASIAKQSSEDVKGAVFGSLRARATKLTNKAITLKWNKVSKVDGYKIYGNQCGKKNHYKLIKDVGKSKTSYTQKKLKKGTYYKYVVAAYKIVDGKKVAIAKLHMNPATQRLPPSAKRVSSKRKRREVVIFMFMHKMVSIKE